ncbi:hypothetical protein B296_00049323 [Ensete ventricosum]|uniref:Uncharacterized protein n=1 Tax=Ensete ventricosum TaxID=4639 RepID=A0A426YCU5_ENSVE|nr:hypothetical protein B296_00049323 [Ensete ventricosum]
MDIRENYFVVNHRVVKRRVLIIAELVTFALAGVFSVGNVLKIAHTSRHFSSNTSVHIVGRHRFSLAPEKRSGHWFSLTPVK